MKLTPNDQNVLIKIFDTDTFTNKIEISDQLRSDPFVDETKVKEFEELEKQAVQHAELKEYSKALEILNGIILQEPRYASAYSNRAQVLRSQNINKDEVMMNLETALKLAKPKSNKVSVRNARILRKVYGQLAAEYLAQSKLKENKFKEWNFQLLSSEMLIEARRFGEKVPKDTAVAFNPYAKLCGSMVDCITNEKWSTM